MFAHLNLTATAVFVFFFALVTGLGFAAAHWRKADLSHIHEWGLGGRRFGSWVTWFLLGGDLYTAYTVIAVPALVYAVGAFGFFGIIYAILIYPLLYATMPRMWAVCHHNNYLTAADFVLGRYGHRGLELAVALTGILATMPYIALQLVGLEKVIVALGVVPEDVINNAPAWLTFVAEVIVSPVALAASLYYGVAFDATATTMGHVLFQHLAITIAFIILALYTFKSGLRAPAMIAFVKDAMIYIFVIAAIIVIPYELGGFGSIFAAAAKAFAAKTAANPNLAAGLTLAPSQIWPFITLSIGSTLALYMYPHAMTGILAANSSRAIRFNAIALPAYSLTLAFIGLMGLMALAAGVKAATPQDAVPALLLWAFPDWFAGFSFAAIALGALVPAAVMSIGAANTFTRNVWKAFIQPNMSSRAESMMAKIMSLIVKLGALGVIFFMPTKFAIDLQLLGGMWMSQIFPAIVLGLFTRWYSGTALLIGWAAGMAVGTSLAWTPTAWVPVHALKWDIPYIGLVDTHLNISVFNGLTAIALNVVVATVLSLVIRPRGEDMTLPSDYADAEVI